MITQKTYGEKLLSPKWQKKRLGIMNRDNFSCRLCRDKENTLHVHHLKYFGEPWDCPDDFLQTLCATCHTIVTEQDIELINKDVFVRQVPREGYTAFILFCDDGVVLYTRSSVNQLIHVASISHDCVRFVVHDAINFWLQTDRNHYLTEKLPETNG